MLSTSAPASAVETTFDVRRSTTVALPSAQPAKSSPRFSSSAMPRDWRQPFRPRRQQLVRLEIDREALVGPGVAVGAPPARVDHERLGAVRDGDGREVREGGAIAGAKDLDLLARRLGHPDLARGRNDAHVVRGGGQLHGTHDRASLRIDDLQRARAAIGRHDEAGLAVELGGGRRSLAVPALERRRRAEAGDGGRCLRRGIDHHDAARPPARDQDALQPGGVLDVIEADAARAVGDGNRLRRRAGRRRDQEQRRDGLHAPAPRSSAGSGP